jgi:Methyltransferase FkbM domain
MIGEDPAGSLQIAKLDEFITMDMDVGVLKADIEGAEFSMLKGATNTLARLKPHIFIEASQETALREIIAFLSDFGYQMKGRYCATPTYLFSV